MANFPTSVYSPASKSAGQTITAAFFNDPDGEITAIEDGYLNGVARLNSSHSTVAALSVTGGSTFTSRPVEPPPHSAKVFAASSQAFGSSQFSTISWVSQEYAINSSMHSTGTNPERLTPQSSGLYLIAAQLLIPSPSSGVKGVGILDSSGGAVAYQRTAVSTNSVLNVTGFKYFDAVGGYVTCRFEGDGASTNSLSSGVFSSWFALTKL